MLKTFLSPLYLPASSVTYENGQAVYRLYVYGEPSHLQGYKSYGSQWGIYEGLVSSDQLGFDLFFEPVSATPSEETDYMSGYRAALQASEGKEISVFFGIEFNFEGDEYLLYGVGEKWLLDNPDMLSWSRRELYRSVHAAGGILVQAHPYRERGYLSRITLTPGICDGIEICNAANPPCQNALAYEYAKKLGVPMTAGSDIHAFYDGPMGGMMFDRKLESVEDYAAELMAGHGTPVLLNGDKVIPVEDIPDQVTVSTPPTLPVITLDE